MRHFKLLIIMLLCAGFAQAQSLDELKSMQSDKATMAADLQAQADALMGEANGLQDQIDKLSGWRKGLGGIFGFEWGRSNNWGGDGVANADETGSVFNAGVAADISGHLLKDTDKTFWHNNLKIVGTYKDLDLANEVGEARADGIFDIPNRVADLFNISSLAGYKISDKFALSGIGELNTTLLDGGFLDPGTVDLGLGATWLPIENMTVSLFPLGYNFVVRRSGDIDGTAAFGLKYKVVYFRDFNIAGKPFHWDTNLTGFFPYAEDSDNVRGQGNQYWQWLNNITFEVWRGIGVGFGFGFRQADFQALDAAGDSVTQTYTTFGLSYSL